LFVYVLFGTLAQIVILPLQIPKRVISDNLINTLDTHQTHRVEYLVIREWFGIVFGRVISFVLLLFVVGLSSTGMQYVLSVVAIAALAELLILQSLKLDTTKL
jgi:hypothetical protein